MPNRIIREGILTSQRIAKLGWAEECFYRRLMSVVDDFGRYFADPCLLRAACYPRQLSKVSDADIEKWLQATEKAALVSVYPAQDGERYLEVLDFNQQVRAKASKFPSPDSSLRSTCVADAQQAQSNAHLDVSVSVDVSEGVSVSVDVPDSVKPTRKKSKVPLPEGFTVSSRVKVWAAENKFPDSRVDNNFAKFVLWAQSKDARYSDWDAALMTAIRDDWASGRAVTGKQSTNRHTGFDERDYSAGVAADGRF